MTTAALYPLDLIKTRMQVIDSPDRTYRTMTGALQATLRTEGIRGLYQGMSPALVASAGSWGGYIYFYESSKERKQLLYRHELTTIDHVSRCIFYFEL